MYTFAKLPAPSCPLIMYQPEPTVLLSTSNHTEKCNAQAIKTIRRLYR